jgi:Na+-driven multidrug efflux pump
MKILGVKLSAVEVAGAALAAVGGYLLVCAAIWAVTLISKR